MNSSVTIDEVQDRILAQPVPLLFLDTCALLDVVRVGLERESSPHRIIPAAEQVAAKAGSSPPELWLLSAAIFDVEWKDNLQGVLDSVVAHIARVDRSLVKLHAADRAISSSFPSERAGDPALPASAKPPQMAPLELPKRLAEVCERVLASMIRLSPDEQVLRAAHLRSMSGLKPADIGKREHPDCLIIETYFALCKSLRSRGFGARSAFVSSNKADFYGQGKPLRPHEDLAGECSAMSLHFAIALDHAVSILYAP
jgi:hypothetical protein